MAYFSHVLLKRAHVVRFPEDGLKRRMQILPVNDSLFHFPVPFHERLRVCCARGPDKARRDGYFLERLRPRFFIQAGLGRAFDVKYPLCPAAPHDLAHSRVRIAFFQIPHLRIGQSLVLYLPQRVAQHRQRPVAQYVELDESELVDAVMHVDLGDDAVFRATGRASGIFARNAAPDRPVGDEHASGMLA